MNANLNQTKKRKHEESTQSIESEGGVHSSSFVAFGLSMFYGKLKSNIFHPKNQQHLEMLDPFVSLLKDCLGSKENKVVSFAIKCLTRLITFPLPSLKIHLEKITTTVLKMIDMVSQKEKKKFNWRFIFIFQIIFIRAKELNHLAYQGAVLNSLLLLFEIAKKSN